MSSALPKGVPGRLRAYRLQDRSVDGRAGAGEHYPRLVHHVRQTLVRLQL
jgi:hypothetical protein